MNCFCFSVFVSRLKVYIKCKWCDWGDGGHYSGVQKQNETIYVYDYVWVGEWSQGKHKHVMFYLLPCIEKIKCVAQ